MTPTPSDDRWRTMDARELPAEGEACELLLPDGEIIPDATFDPVTRKWKFDVPAHLRSRTLYLSGWRPAGKGA